MLKQTENRVKIEGILSEIDLEPKTFTKNGSQVNAIGGSIKVRVTQPVNGVDTELEVPVYMFASEFTNDGRSNPAYESISRILKEYVSIAAGGIDTADRIRITNGQITMNEYYGKNGNLISFPRINASFVTKIRKEDCNPEATFSVVFAVGSADYETDKDGVATDHYKVSALLPQYGGKVDVVPFYAINSNVIDAISNYWSVGDTVKATGRLNFTTKTETVTTENDFGEPKTDARTISVSELIITGGTSTPMEGDFAINADDLQIAITDRKNRLAQEKEKSNGSVGTSGRAPGKASGNRFKDLGF